MVSDPNDVDEFEPAAAPTNAGQIDATQIHANVQLEASDVRTGIAIDTVPTNDGKRRIDIMIHKIGMESPATAGVPTARGDLLVCQLYTKRVAGEFEDSPKEAETKREQPMKVWFARFDN